MKHIFIPLIVIFIVACKKDNTTPVNPYISPYISPSDTTKGRAFAEMNGKSEAFFFYPWTYDTDSTTICFSIKRNNDLESITIEKIKKTLNPQMVYKTRYDTIKGGSIDSTNARGGSMWTDGDVICERLEILESDSLNNYVQITKQIDNYKEVFGTFSLTFIKTQDCEERHYSDTLRIRNGYFHLYLK